MRVAVLGAGSYGTCLAIHLDRLGHDVSLWARTSESARTMEAERENRRYLPGFPLEPDITVTASLQEALQGCSIVLGVTPTHAIRVVFAEALPWLTGDMIIVNASKGIEPTSLSRIDEIYQQVLPLQLARRAVFLSGPTFAKEVAARLPSAIVVAGRQEDTTKVIQHAFSSDEFRVYRSDDVVGVQVGGALKNVVAICAGLSDGLGFGHNARAALITRGLAEISRFGAAMGANPLTFAGLSGLGDLVLTCTGDLSRNRRLGLALAEGKKLEAIVEEMGMAVEGVWTSQAASALAKRHGIDAPLAQFVYRVLYEDLSVRDGFTSLMARSLRAERD